MGPTGPQGPTGLIDSVQTLDSDVLSYLSAASQNIVLLNSASIDWNITGNVVTFYGEGTLTVGATGTDSMLAVGIPGGMPAPSSPSKIRGSLSMYQTSPVLDLSCQPRGILGTGTTVIRLLFVSGKNTLGAHTFSFHGSYNI